MDLALEALLAQLHLEGGIGGLLLVLVRPLLLELGRQPDAEPHGAAQAVQRQTGLMNGIVLLGCGPGPGWLRRIDIRRCGRRLGRHCCRDDPALNGRVPRLGHRQPRQLPAELDELRQRLRVILGPIRPARPAAAGAAFLSSLGRLGTGRVGLGGWRVFVGHVRNMNHT